MPALHQRYTIQATFFTARSSFLSFLDSMSVRSQKFRQSLPYRPARRVKARETSAPYASSRSYNQMRSELCCAAAAARRFQAASCAAKVSRTLRCPRRKSALEPLVKETVLFAGSALITRARK